jgi:hypothetical protein
MIDFSNPISGRASHLCKHKSYFSTEERHLLFEYKNNYLELNDVAM